MAELAKSAVLKDHVFTINGEEFPYYIDDTPRVEVREIGSDEHSVKMNYIHVAILVDGEVEQ